MAQPKRPASQAGPSGSDADAKKARTKVDLPPKRGRPKRVENDSAASNKKDVPITAAAERSLRAPNGQSTTKSESKSAKGTKSAKPSAVTKTSSAAETSASTKNSKPVPKKAKMKSAAGMRRTSNFSINIPADNVNGTKGGVTADEDNANDDEVEDEDHDGPSYWLMKAEPESRIEKGKDVKFSIDDLKACTEPEAWDGVRNLGARNNLRAMLKGDLAFFYHSNCKVPGIAGVMQIVQEHSIDESAFDPEHPYFDAKSTRDKPKWFVVHVEYRVKFKELIKLKDLQKFAKDGGILQNMQTLKQSCLSVSKVSKKEWDFIWSLAEVDETAKVDEAAKSSDKPGPNESRALVKERQTKLKERGLASPTGHSPALDTQDT
ncbi:hypothetical protein MMC13_000382 [Lambiella insularis]|nr:hypothetical protein [Lambiella insularis]